jgi:NAD-specific glutamate dehydrogenase
LPLRELTNEALTCLGEGYDRRRQSIALGIGNDHRFPAFHHGDYRIGRAKVDSDNLCHVFDSFVGVMKSNLVL